MGISDRLGAAWRAATTPGRTVSYTSSNWAIPPGQTTQGYLDAYGQIGWLFAAVSRIAAGVSEAKWHLYSTRGPERKLIEGHPLTDLLDYVNPHQTGQEFMELTAMYLDLVGESFWWVNKTVGGKPAELWLIPPQHMHIVPSRERYIAGYVYEQGNDKTPFEPDEIIHVKYPNPANQYRGIGPAQAIGTELDSFRFAGNWNKRFFYNDATPGIVLEYPNNLPTEEYNRLKEQWGHRHQGYGNAHKIAILSGGGKANRAMLSQTDMGFEALRKLNRDEILGAFGVPYSVLGGAENINRANAEAADYTFARWVIKPRLAKLASKLNEQFCPMFGPDLVLAPADPVPENKEYTLGLSERGVKGGLLTVNEGRQLLGYDPIEGYDIIREPGPQPFSLEMPKAFISRPMLATKALPDAEDVRHWNAFVKGLDKPERDFTAQMRAIFRRQLVGVVAKLKGKKGARVKQELGDLYSVDEWAEELSKLAQPLISARLKAAGEVWASELGISFDVTNPRVVRWLGERTREFGKQVSSTTADAIAEQLRQAHAAGESIPQIQERIQHVFDIASDSRAEAIARTEMVGASNRGALESYQQGNVRFKRWLAALDERTRETHVEADGQVVGIDENFRVGRDSMQAPGQGSDPGEVINCRCTLTPIVED